MIAIEYDAVPNANEAAGGWVPQVWVNDQPIMRPWRPVGLEREDALQRARFLAYQEAEERRLIATPRGAEGA